MLELHKKCTEPEAREDLKRVQPRSDLERKSFHAQRMQPLGKPILALENKNKTTGKENVYL